MQLKKSITLSKVAGIAIITFNALYAENYVAIEYLQYDENDNRVTVQAPSFTASYDIGTDFTLKGDFVNDSVSGATPTWKLDKNNQFIYDKQTFTEDRKAGSLMLTSRFKNRDELNLGIDRSEESDFYSTTASSEYMHYINSTHNQSINIGVSYSANEILSYNANTSSLTTPINTATSIHTATPTHTTTPTKNTDTSSGASERKLSNPLQKDNNNFDTTSGASQKETSNSVNIELGFTQILNQNSALKIGAFSILDKGYLTNPHARIVRNIDVRHLLEVEHRPDKRVAFGGTLNYITMLGDSISLKLDYRFYDDDWDITSHTIESGLYYNLNKYFTLGTGVRYYTQTEAFFYNPSQYFFTNQKDASSDDRLSNFDALRYNASIEFRQNENFSYNLSGKFYTQSTGLDAIMFTAGVKYTF